MAAGPHGSAAIRVLWLHDCLVDRVPLHLSFLKVALHRHHDRDRLVEGAIYAASRRLARAHTINPILDMVRHLEFAAFHRVRRRESHSFGIAARCRSFSSELRQHRHGLRLPLGIVDPAVPAAYFDRAVSPENERVRPLVAVVERDDCVHVRSGRRLLPFVRLAAGLNRTGPRSTAPGLPGNAALPQASKCRAFRRRSRRR